MSTSTLPTASLLENQLMEYRETESSIIGEITEVRFLTETATMEIEEMRRKLTKMNAEKKRMIQWKTENQFKYQDLKLKAKQFEGKQS